MDLSLDHVKDVYEQQLGADGPVPQLIGRYMADPNGNVSVLADYHGYLSGLEGEDPQKFVATLNSSPYFRVVSRQEMLEGKHLDLMPESEIPEGSLRPASVFDYHHPTAGRPDEARLPGRTHAPERSSSLSHEEVGADHGQHPQEAGSRSGIIKQHGRSRRWRAVFEDLMKIEPHLADALDSIASAPVSQLATSTLTFFAT
jgi:hypothetical protein